MARAAARPRAAASPVCAIDVVQKNSVRRNVRVRSRKARAFRPGSSVKERASELEAKPELHATRIPWQGTNPHEVRIGEAGDRVSPSHMVQHVLRLRPELDAALTDREPAEQAEVEVPLIG